jgi:hypothetical protein
MLSLRAIVNVHERCEVKKMMAILIYTTAYKIRILWSPDDNACT